MEYDKIKKIIECSHLNFLIGSGASKPFLGTLGGIEQLLTDLSIDKTCGDDEKKIIEASIKKHYFDVAIGGNSDLKKDDLDLETTKNNYIKFYSSINTILQKRKTNLISRQANIFTTNMDLLSEHALEKEGLSYNDGFFGRMDPFFGTENFNNSLRKTSLHFEYQSEVPLFNLLKIHGSLNWKLSSDEKILYDGQLETLKSIEEIVFDPAIFLEIEYKITNPKQDFYKTYTISELRTQINEKSISKAKEHEYFLESYDKLVMINPTKDKFETTTRKLIFYELLRIYANALEKENSVLFAFGFSFADEHIREITIRAAKANPTLLIIILAYSENTKTAIEKIFPSRGNIIILTDPSKYSLDIVNKNLFEKLANELIHSND